MKSRTLNWPCRLRTSQNSNGIRSDAITRKYCLYFFNGFSFILESWLFSFHSSPSVHLILLLQWTSDFLFCHQIISSQHLISASGHNCERLKRCLKGRDSSHSIKEEKKIHPVKKLYLLQITRLLLFGNYFNNYVFTTLFTIHGNEFISNLNNFSIKKRINTKLFFKFFV